ncbi:hypothetical protein WJX73_001640 [Symbiochloris irregularis]|uniref:Amino acid transporter transmembrane domain-containing protein n=1 Tax=Symbiochloris irregularis TaxID=706552 RepID=A0AAW1PZA9_9CHLO
MGQEDGPVTRLGRLPDATPGDGNSLPHTDGVGANLLAVNDAFYGDVVDKTVPLPPVEHNSKLGEGKDFNHTEESLVLDDARAQGDAVSDGKPGFIRSVRNFCSEGHTPWDAFLSVASSAVGQVILTYPYQLAIMGIIPGIFIGIGVGLLNFYTLWLMIILYLHRKKDMVKAGEWYNDVDSNGYQRRRTVTQYHDIIGFSLGRYPFGLLGQLLTALYILGVAIQQVVASASSQHTINPEYSKRTLTLILGGPILIFGFLPRHVLAFFRSVRVLNLLALVGTNYSCLYFFIYAVHKGGHRGIITRGPLSIQDFFLGAAVVGSAGHSISMEIMDSMRRSRQFTIASFTGWVWNIILLLPHSIAIVLAFPQAILAQANVYAVLPNSGFKSFSVYIMLFHNIAAFTLHTNPLLYMWEKLIRTHHTPWYIRIPSRTPVLAVIWVLSLAIPFYGTINSLFSALCVGLTAFFLPTLAFNWHYRTEQRRRDCPITPPWPLHLWGWKPLFAFNTFLLLFFLGTSTGCGIYYSIKQLIANIHTFHVFAACFQCTSKS